MKNRNALLRELPKVDEVLRLLAGETGGAPEIIVKRAVQEQIGRWRERILTGEINTVLPDGILEAIRNQVENDSAYHLQGVINATGVVLHTNLGRARMSRPAAEHLVAVAIGYSNLEYQLESGERGSRYAHVENLLTQLTGAEAALVVNNNAAAVLLTLDTLAKGKEVIVSRGELVEIGGAFRVPAIMERSGCEMIEVGTTNKTHPSDYTDHITERTGALLKVHTSNYRIVGFTGEVALPELWRIGSSRDIPVIYDLGSGLLTDLASRGIGNEPTVSQCAPYADVLCFSGDKLLGGPQAGIIVGRRESIGRMRKNHLLRALRIDKLTLAALEYTLRQYLQPEAALQTIPTLEMITASMQRLEEKRTMLASLLKLRAGIYAELIALESQVGGGSMPDVVLPSCGLSLYADQITPDGLESCLRCGDPPVIARVMKERVLLDMRTIDYEEIPVVAARLNGL